MMTILMNKKYQFKKKKIINSSKRIINKCIGIFKVNKEIHLLQNNSEILVLNKILTNNKY